MFDSVNQISGSQKIQLDVSSYSSFQNKKLFPVMTTRGLNKLLTFLGIYLEYMLCWRNITS